MEVQIITDSTCDIPPGMGEQLGIRVVPIYVRFGDRTYRDSVDISIDALPKKVILPLNPRGELFLQLGQF